MVLCAPHPLAGCQCVLCLQLSTDSDTVPYEIVTDEGSLLPRGSAVLVRGRRVGTVVYFGHRKHQARGSDGPAAPLLPPPAPGTHDLPADECARSLACPLGVTVQLWPPDEGEVFVPLNDVICQLDEGGDSSSGGVEEAPTLREGDDTHSNNSSSRRDSEDMNSHTADLDHTLTDTHTSQDIGRLIQDTWAEEEVHSVTKDPRHTREHLSISVAEAGHRTQGTVDKDGYGECGEDMGHHGGRHFSSVSDTSSTCESLGSRGMEDVSRGPAGYHGSRSEALPRRSKVTGSDQRCLECEGDIESRVGDLHRHPSQGPIRYHGSQSEALPRRMKVTGSDQRCLECEDDLESQYSECDKGKLQFGDTWDSGCYMSLGRHSSECSEQFSDPESEYGSTGHPWGSSLEEALNSVWQKHKHGDTLTPYLRRTPADTFILDSEVELQDYRGHGKIREDTVC
ncbi:hypothetical protein O3P69_009345 [Scylla paramamosain]|uniref:Uncharacterized protein n=1 Tax=Scylla paramamosain TaxID=85552 RepID=A0AAW0TA64_SCYPA